MASSGYSVSMLQFQLPQSPLLSGCANFSEDFFSALSAQGICSPLPTFSFAKPSRSPLLSPPAKSVRPALSPRRHREKPLPAVPPLTIPPKQIISLLNLLDQIDDDIAKDTQRVREAIKEVRCDIAEVRAEFRADRERMGKQRAVEKRETKGVDDDFWLNA